MIPAWREGDRWFGLQGPLPPNVGLSWSVQRLSNNQELSSAANYSGAFGYSYGTKAIIQTNESFYGRNEFEIQNVSPTVGATLRSNCTGIVQSIRAHESPFGNERLFGFARFPSSNFPCSALHRAVLSGNDATALSAHAAVFPELTASEGLLCPAFTWLSGSTLIVAGGAKAALGAMVYGGTWYQRVYRGLMGVDYTISWTQLNTVFPLSDHETTSTYCAHRLVVLKGRLLYMKISAAGSAVVSYSDDGGVTWSTFVALPAGDVNALFNAVVAWNVLWWFDRWTRTLWGSQDGINWTIINVFSVATLFPGKVDIGSPRYGHLVATSTHLYLVLSSYFSGSPSGTFSIFLRSPA